MTSPNRFVRLRKTESADLDFVLGLESRPDYRSLIGRWSRAEHELARVRRDREHWIIERLPERQLLGYLIAYDLRAWGLGMYVKRIAVAEPSKGVGRVAMKLFLEHAFSELEAVNVLLDVFRHNFRARRAYESVGFTEVNDSQFDRARLSELVGESSDASVLMSVQRKSEVQTQSD